ncbi:phage integrase N-terminal SAM-like domain-containing protein [Roseateles koreensis]|uniref:phage integrase N-terminal SAM-like domain-containing protein n=1 Tax=Roseateles koreensis TaxID=2987526 RepID=UPI00396477CC
MGAAKRKALSPEVVSATLPSLKAPRLLDQLRERIRFLHYSRSTEDAYVFWVRAFIRHYGLRHPRDLDGAAVESFLTPGWPANGKWYRQRTGRPCQPCCSSTAKCWVCNYPGCLRSAARDRSGAYQWRCRATRLSTSCRASTNAYAWPA